MVENFLTGKVTEKLDAVLGTRKASLRKVVQVNNPAEFRILVIPATRLAILSRCIGTTHG